MKKAIIAMSGGVDSSVAAYLMKTSGYECIGATMKLYDNEAVNLSDKSCCTEEDVADARAVAEKLGIPYYVFNFKDEFEKKVIENFISVYERGGTPNPCIQCNRYLKFEKLMTRMRELGFDYVVTGHYASVEEKNGRFYLKKGKDSSKDQSYVLYSLTQEQLSHTVFPLGEYTKQEIRRIADKQGFINADKSESQDICFVPDGDYSAFIEKYRGYKYPNGSFVNKNGDVLGEHSGIIRYTVGQRKGLGIAVGHPVYVIRKDTEKNEVVLGSNEDLFTDTVIVEDFNLIYPETEKELRCKAKIRYNIKEADCTAVINKDRAVLKFDKPVRAAASGQAAVLYDGEYVIGGGTIV
ncbi:MAG: tRNA 2-thiouridine(34) synthase MnmA [Eubacterium sp.]|nr:tRNA 2-thiouridine(34) synthase MnmA [Eubacterium sp.]